MHASKSDHTSGSKRCCNRSTCPFYMCSRQNSGTVFESAQDETSTQFLYFGQNFGGNPSGEIQEFRDCRSETDPPLDAPGNPYKLNPAATSMSTFEPNNYGIILKQIICMSQKLLSQIERRDQRHSIDMPPSAARGFGDNYMPVSQTQNQEQQTSPPNWKNPPQRSNCTGVVPTAGASNIPLALRMLQIEPVHLTIPFTLHFQGLPPSGVGAAASPSATSGVMGSVRVSSITAPNIQQANEQCPPTPFGYKEEGPEAPSLIGLDHFPYTIGTQTDIYVSEGKFPPVKVQQLPIDQCPEREEQRFPQQSGTPLVNELCDLEIPPEACTTTSDKSSQHCGTVDKGIQTERRHSRKNDIESVQAGFGGQDGQGRTGVRTSQDLQDGQYSEHPEDIPDYREKPSESGKRRKLCTCDICTCPPMTRMAPPTVPPKPAPITVITCESGDEPKVEPAVPRVEPALPPKPPAKIYRLAFPQHRDLNICNKCRFQPSPLFDSEGRVFCPGKCGCCLCPWKTARRSGAVTTHDKMKVCTCRGRLALFSEPQYKDMECSDSSFDICPCRERAESRFIELYGKEMYMPDETLAKECYGAEVLLSDVVEIKRIPESCTETDSHRNNTYLESATEEATAPTIISEQPLDDRTSSVNNPQHISFSGAGEEEATVTTEQLLYEESDLQRLSQLQETQLEKLLEEQQLYEKPPPPLDLSENKSASSKLPQNMSYPSQYGRCLSCPICSGAMNQQQPGVDAPVCCRCKCNKKRKSRAKSCKSVSTFKSQSPTRVGDDDYFSPASDTEVDKKCPAKKASSKQQVCIKSSSTQPVDAAIMEVLDRMMKVLEFMDSKNRQNLQATGSSSMRSQLCEQEVENDFRTSESVDISRNMERRFFTCLENPACSEEDSFVEDRSNCAPYEEMPDGEIPRSTTDNMPCAVPYMMITFDPETGLPCCCLHSGAVNSPCQEVPVINATNAGVCSSARRNLQTPNKRTICKSEDYGDEELYDVLIQDEMQIINETQIRVVTTEECDICEESYTQPEIKVESNRDLLITLCAETQTDGCLGPFSASGAQRSIDLLEELRAFREELNETESYNDAEGYKMPSASSKSRSGGDIRAECDCCHCRAERQKSQSVPNTFENCKKELKALVDSVIMDLESMEKVRRQNVYNLKYNDESTRQPKSAIKSFPVTITEVTELGRSSLYVKWTIHDCFGIGGYEIYVDGYMTNRYFNPKHEAAVVCEVDVTQPHKIALTAKPKATTEKSILGADDIYTDDEPIPTPIYWSPSIYLYEPNSSMDYCKMF